MVGGQLATIWNYDDSGALTDFQTAIGGAAGTRDNGSIGTGTPSYVTAIASMARPILLLPDGSTLSAGINDTADAAAVPAALMVKWWTGNLTAFVGQLTTFTLQIQVAIIAGLNLNKFEEYD